MNYSNELLIEAALNFAGFLISGLLMTVAYSMSYNRAGEQTAMDAGNANAKADMEQKEADMEPRGKVEFVNFQGMAADKTEQTVERFNRFQRNRLEVINQTEDMLNSGKSSEAICHRLAIAEAELKIVNQTRNNRSMQESANVK